MLAGEAAAANAEVEQALRPDDDPGSAAFFDVDNTLMQGQPYAAGGDVTANGAAIASFNAAVAADPRIEQVLLPVRDGITLIRRVDTGTDGR